MNQPETIIIGGGLAGLSCGYELSKKGIKALILESKSVLGGRTSSWLEDSMQVESGLHRFLGFYKELPKLLKNCNVKLSNIICWEDEIEIKLKDGSSAIYGASFYKPFKTLKGIIGNRNILSFKDKFSLAKFFISGFFCYIFNPKYLDTLTVTEYAKKHNITKNALERILIPLTAGIFFIPPERYSAFALFGLLAQAVPRFYKIRIGAFKGGMSEVMINPIAEKIKTLGGKIKVCTDVDSLIVQDNKVIGVLVKGEKILAKHVVMATSIGAAQKILKNSFKNFESFDLLLKLPTMSSVTIQIELNRPSSFIDRTTFAPLTDIACYSEQVHTTFTNTKGRLSVILTPPEKFVEMSDLKIFELTCDVLRTLGIDISRDMLKDYKVISEINDFYELSPGSEKLRPSQKTEMKNFTLAGDYTKQPMLATMEGAVISGKKAAQIVYKSLSS